MSDETKLRAAAKRITTEKHYDYWECNRNPGAMDDGKLLADFACEILDARADARQDLANAQADPENRHTVPYMNDPALYDGDQSVRDQLRAASIATNPIPAAVEAALRGAGLGTPALSTPAAPVLGECRMCGKPAGPGSELCDCCDMLDSEVAAWNNPQPPSIEQQVAELDREAAELTAKSMSPVAFAREAIRLNLVMRCYKNEVVLMEAMSRLASLLRHAR